MSEQGFMCGECGRTELSISEGPYEVQFRDEKYRIDGVEYMQCANCAAITFTRNQYRALELRAASEAREAQHLLTGEEIEDLRDYLNVTQVELEEILGTGPKTVTRWISGRVFQSRANDDRMRMIRAAAEGLDLPARCEHAELIEKLKDLPALVADLAREVTLRKPVDEASATGRVSRAAERPRPGEYQEASSAASLVSCEQSESDALALAA